MVKGRALISRAKFQSESKMKCSLKSVKGEKENRDLNNVKLIQVLVSRLFTFLGLFELYPKSYTLLLHCDFSTDLFGSLFLV